jgi:hypothetical protein
LKNEFKDKWLNINIESDDSVQNTIIKIAKQRMYQTNRFAYLGYRVPCPLLYMTSGELIRLIVSDAYWKFFREYFPGSKEIISNKLDEIGAIRNALAHFRPIKQDDINLIKQNASQVLSIVETCLIDLIRCANTVSTNTEEDWFINLKTLGTEYCRFSFNQSEDEKWVKVSFIYTGSVLGSYHSSYGGGRRYRALNLITPKILLIFPQLQALLTYLSEDIIYPNTTGNVTAFLKPIHMVFSRKVISQEFDNIKKQIETLLLQISEETSMLLNDNLARGILIQSVDTLAKYRNYQDGTGFWDFKTSNFINLIKENDPSEYWGLLGYGIDNYISSTHEFPWMPINISEPDF